MEVQDSNNTTDAVAMNGKNKNNEQAKQVEVVEGGGESSSTGFAIKILKTLLVFSIIFGIIYGILFLVNYGMNILKEMMECEKSTIAINFFNEEIDPKDDCEFHGIPFISVPSPIPIATFSYLLIVIIVLFILSWRYYYKYIWSCGNGTRKIHDDKSSKIFDDMYSPTFTDRKTMTNDELIDLYCEQIAFESPRYAKGVSKEYIKHGRDMEKLKNSWKKKHVVKRFMIDMDFWDSDENLKEEKLNLVWNSKKIFDVIENQIKEGLKSEDEQNKEIMKLCQENVPSWEKYSVENGDFKIHKFSEGLQQASGDKYLRRVECIAAVKGNNSSSDEKNGPILKSVVVESNHKRGPNKQHELEQHVLKLIEDHGIHPKIYYHGKHYRIVEFIKGKSAFRFSFQLEGLGLLKFLFLYLFVHIWFLKYVYLFFRSTCCKLSTKDENGVLCPETLKALGETIGLVHSLPIHTVYKDFYNEETYTKLTRPGQARIGKNGRLYFDDGFSIINGIDE